MTGYIPAQSIVGSQVGKKKHNAAKSGKSAFSLDNIAGGAFDALHAIFGAKNTAGSLAEAIEKQAAGQKRQAEAKALSNMPGAVDPYQSLQDQLYAMVNGIDGDIQATPLEKLQQMAQSQVGAQYDPQIQALGQEVARRQGTAKRSKAEARDMYGGLAKDYLSQLPELTAQYKAEDDSTNQRYDQAQQQMGDTYKQNADNQNALLKQLGIQAAAPDASQQAQDDQAYFQNQAEMDQQSALSALNEQQNAQTDYTRNLSSNAKFAGENTAQDIGQQLRDFLDQASGQRNQLQSQKAGAIQALLSQMQQQDAERVSDSRQQQFGNAMQLFNFQLDAQKAGDSAASKLAESQNMNPFGSSSSVGGSGGSGLTTGLAGASNYLASQYPDQPILASNLMEQLNDVLANKDVVNGKFVLDPGNESLGQAPKYSDVGQEKMMDLLRHEFEGQGNRYNTGDINSTMNALLAYLGKLR